MSSPINIYRTANGTIAAQAGEYYSIPMSWSALLADTTPYETVNAALANAEKIPAPQAGEWRCPILDTQELWACGVTYIRSRDGRQEESKDAGGGDFYARVYEAERPEVFMKATPHRVVGHGKPVRIRKDSGWDVPEPELTLVVNTSGKIIGFTVGNDMSSRSIEGENPLYLPQAKTYDGCAALGPGILLTPDGKITPETKIELVISRSGQPVFQGSVKLEQMRRTPEELVGFVYRECSFPTGCFIMTGTGIVPPSEFTLKPGDQIDISIDGIGTLTNTVADA